MAYFFSAGQGHCPTTYKTVVAYYSRNDLNRLRDLIAGHETYNDLLIATIGGVLGPSFAGALANLGLSATSAVGGYAISSYLSRRTSMIDNITMNNSGSGFNIRFKLSCINKGLNGHYWSINSMQLA